MKILIVIGLLFFIGCGSKKPKESVKPQSDKATESQPSEAAESQPDKDVVSEECKKLKAEKDKAGIVHRKANDDLDLIRSTYGNYVKVIGTDDSSAAYLKAEYLKAFVLLQKKLGTIMTKPGLHLKSVVSNSKFKHDGSI